MRDMLEPIFGESGAVVAQFVITLVVVLAVIALVYWVYQRFAFTRFKGVGRGRIPRLAIVDALPVDGRRKLVLIRRDHVEHLILIGGTSDLVVEPSIMRGVPARQRPGQPPGQPPRPQHAPAAAAQGTASSPAQQPPQPSVHAQSQQQPRRVEPTGISEPIPFPQARRPQPSAPAANGTPLAGTGETDLAPPQNPPQRRAAVRAAPASEPMSTRSEPASAHFEEPARPTRIESVLSLAEALDDITDEPTSSDDVTEFAGTKSRPAAQLEDETPATAADETGERAAEAFEVGGGQAPATAAEDATAESDEADPSGTEGRDSVGDLEREMARLLGEITAKRDS